MNASAIVALAAASVVAWTEGDDEVIDNLIPNYASQNAQFLLHLYSTQFYGSETEKAREHPLPPSAQPVSPSGDDRDSEGLSEFDEAIKEMPEKAPTATAALCSLLFHGMLKYTPLAPARTAADQHMQWRKVSRFVNKAPASERAHHFWSAVRLKRLWTNKLSRVRTLDQQLRASGMSYVSPAQMLKRCGPWAKGNMRFVEFLQSRACRVVVGDREAGGGNTFRAVASSPGVPGRIQRVPSPTASTDANASSLTSPAPTVPSTDNSTPAATTRTKKKRKRATMRDMLTRLDKQVQAQQADTRGRQTVADERHADAVELRQVLSKLTSTLAYQSSPEAAARRACSLLFKVANTPARRRALQRIAAAIRQGNDLLFAAVEHLAADSVDASTIDELLQICDEESD